MKSKNKGKRLNKGAASPGATGGGGDHGSSARGLKYSSHNINMNLFEKLRQESPLRTINVKSKSPKQSTKARPINADLRPLRAAKSPPGTLPKPLSPLSKLSFHRPKPKKFPAQSPKQRRTRTKNKDQNWKPSAYLFKSAYKAWPMESHLSEEIIPNNIFAISPDP